MAQVKRRTHLTFQIVQYLTQFLLERNSGKEVIFGSKLPILIPRTKWLRTIYDGFFV